jgi:hypothetical protein
MSLRAVAVMILLTLFDYRCLLNNTKKKQQINKLPGFQSAIKLHQAAATGWRILMPTFGDIGVPHGQHNRSPQLLISVF